MKIDKEDFNRKAQHIVDTVVKPQVEKYERAKAIEVAAANLADPNVDKTENWIAGAKWQAERMYSEEEAGELVYNIIGKYAKQYGIMIDGAKLNALFEQFKKK
jgi:hypothetical protein